MIDLTDGKEYWSIYVDQSDSNNYLDDSELTTPWRGRIVSEQRQGGRFTVLATRVGEGGDLSNAFYVIIPHQNFANRLLFETFEMALDAWARERTSLAIDMIDNGLFMLKELDDAKSKIMADHNKAT